MVVFKSSDTGNTAYILILYHVWADRQEELYLM